MKILTLVGLILIFTVNSAFTQQSKIKESAQVCADAVVNNDYATIIKFTYPKLIELIGGKERLINSIKEAQVKLSEQGAVLEKVAIGPPGQIYQAGEELHCLVPEALKLKVKNGYLLSLSYLLAVSADKGNNWVFVDIVGLPPEQLKVLFPNFNYSLIIPQPTKPILYRDTVK